MEKESKEGKEYKEYSTFEISKPLMACEPPSEYGYANPQLYTYANYLSWADDKRREIINGVVFSLFSAPTRWHAEVSMSISTKFWNYITKRKGKCKVYYAPFDVRFPKKGKTADNEIDTVVQPDICVICDPKKLDKKGCIGAPDLIVEIQSPSTAPRDLREKFDLYEQAGVKEYWIVFPKDGVTVFLLQDNGKFDTGTSYEYKFKVPVSIFEGLEIDLSEHFEE